MKMNEEMESCGDQKELLKQVLGELEEGERDEVLLSFVTKHKDKIVSIGDQCKFLLLLFGSRSDLFISCCDMFFFAL